MANIRLYVDHPLSPGQSVALSRPQANYLFAVMRLEVGAVVTLFNGRDGAFDAEVVQANKRGGILVARAQTQPFQRPPDLWLLFAPLKKARTDFIVEKTTELGVAEIFPVQTDFTNSDRLRPDKMRAHAIEAAEQCGATYVPKTHDIKRLSAVLDTWPEDRQLLFCDETLVGTPHLLDQPKGGKWAILIGPEGGFSAKEHNRLKDFKFAHRISLGPRILRAETAAVAAITLWQSALGDW